jgi:hypothetical protein
MKTTKKRTPRTTRGVQRSNQDQNSICRPEAYIIRFTCVNNTGKAYARL